MIHNTLQDIGWTKARKTTVECRETAAAQFFKGWKDALHEAQKKGLWRWQFRQNNLVTFHDTKAAAKVTKAISDLGFKAKWVPRVIEKTDPANPFGEFLYIRELRVWWHQQNEHVEELTVAGGAIFEGMPREEHEPDIAIPEVATSSDRE